MQTAFLGQAYASRSPVLASQTAVNIYPEINETGGSDIGGFFGTPGRKARYTGSGEVRGLWEAEGYRYGVIGDTVYSWDSSWTATSLGTLPNSSGRVSMIDNGAQLAIAHQDGWHYVALGGSSIAAVSGAPTGTSILATQDQYVLFTEDVGGEFGLTALGDLSSINALDVATAEGLPDNLVSLAVLHNEAWLFGTDSIEIWDNTGAAFFPFQRAAGGFIEQGCAAKFSVALLDNSLFWLGRNARGQGVIYRANSYIPQRISTFAIEEAINAYSDISDAIGFAYQEEGHSFYQLTFPTGDATWVYDVSTRMWHRRAWMDSDGTLHRDRANCYANFAGEHIMGDWGNGKVYQSSALYTDDDGTPIYRERAWELPTGEHKKVRLDYLELLALMGDGDGAGGAPIVWLQVSHDAGQTWSYERQRTLGPIGSRKTRARWRRLGAGRDTVMRVGTTMTQRVSWVGAIAEGDQYSV